MFNLTVVSKISIGPTAEVIIPVAPTAEHWRRNAAEEAPAEVPLQSSTLTPGVVLLSVDF
jgi:hypothetical protein